MNKEIIMDMNYQGLINKLLASNRPEELAVKIGRSVATINLWKAGKRKPSKGDYEMLKRLK